MKQSKAFRDLTIQNGFLFGAVMMDPTICKHTIELALGFPIERIEPVIEKSMIHHPAYHGIRLDVYAKDANNTHYDVEMQVQREKSLTKRARYYHSQMDMELLQSGSDYEGLSDGYVIFICCFDPFGEKRYRYTVAAHCKETGSPVPDGITSIYLSTEGRNCAEEPQELIRFLEYVKANDPGNQKDYQDDFVRQLQKRILEIKTDREMEGKYMLLELMLKDERKEGISEGRMKGLMEGRINMARENVLYCLGKLGEVPKSVCTLINEQTDTGILLEWSVIAARSASVEEFQNQIK